MAGRSLLRSGKFIRRLALILGIAFTAAMALIFTFMTPVFSVQFFTSWYALLTSFLLLMFLLLMARSMYKKPEPVAIPVFGLPRSGKSVYLHMLFDRLRVYHAHNFKSSNPNEQLSALIARNVKMLAQESWLPHAAEPRELYRILLTLGSQLLPERLEVTLIDFNMRQGDNGPPVTPEIVSRQGIYNNLARANGIFFVIDSQSLYGGSFTGSHTIDVYMNAVHEIRRTAGLQQTATIPVALIMTKIDYVEHTLQPSQLIGLIQDFIDLCKKSFRNFRIFYVSSVGKLAPTGLPLPPLRPRNVIEPFLWMVEHFN